MEANMTNQVQQKSAAGGSSGSVDGVYVIGMFGAWVYYFKRAGTTQERVKAFFKGLVWPAFLVYALLVSLETE
jgi:hypothetical protein